MKSLKLIIVCIILICFTLIITSCTTESETGDDDFNVDLTELNDTTYVWNIEIGNGENIEDNISTDQYWIEYKGSSIPNLVQLEINNSLYTLEYSHLDTHGHVYNFSDPVSFMPGAEYHIKLIVNNNLVEEESIKMPDRPNLSCNSNFMPNQNHNFQWTLNNSSDYQYFLSFCDENEGFHSISYINPNARSYTYIADTLPNNYNRYGVSVGEINFKRKNDVIFKAMIADFKTLLIRKYWKIQEEK